MTSDIVIVGTGGFAREVEWLICRLNEVGENWNLLGFIDDVDDSSVIGNDSYVINCEKDLSVALAIGNPAVRKKLYQAYRQNPHISFPNLIDSSIKLSDSVQMGEGNILCEGSIFTVDIQMGNCNIVNLGCTIGHDVKIGNFTIINPGSNISGNVTLNDGVNVGTGTKIIQGLTVGAGAVLGAGSVVIRDIPENITAVGIPAKPIRKVTEGSHD